MKTRVVHQMYSKTSIPQFFLEKYRTTYYVHVLRRWYRGYTRLAERSDPILVVGGSTGTCTRVQIFLKKFQSSHSLKLEIKMKSTATMCAKL